MNHQVLTFRRMEQFTDYLFDNRDEARKAALILPAILEAHSPRLSNLAEAFGREPRLQLQDAPKVSLSLYLESFGGQNV